MWKESYSATKIWWFEILNTGEYKQTAMKLQIGNTILKYMG